MSRMLLNLAGVALLAAAVLVLLRPTPPAAWMAGMHESLPPAPKTVRAAGNFPTSHRETLSAAPPLGPAATVELPDTPSRTTPSVAPTSRSQSSSPDGRRSRRIPLRVALAASSASPSIASESHNTNAADAFSQQVLESVFASIPPQIPAVLIEIDDPLVSHPEARERLAAVATDFTTPLTESGLDPASPAYQELWDQERILAEIRFRSMYGGQVWMNHHIQSHHAAADPSQP